MRKTVAILAPTGMLGSMVYHVLGNKYNLILVYRDKEKLQRLFKTYGKNKNHKTFHFDLLNIFEDYTAGFTTSGPELTKLINKLKQVDYIINCAGITKPHSLKNPNATMFINGYLPVILSRIFKEKLIQITTDCVYDGATGAPYNEESAKTPNDLYGLSKSLGEPQEALVLRTSIIGPEICEGELLIEWLKKQNNKSINGFTNHLWNGITTKQFAIICDKVISNPSKFPSSGVFHVFSTSVSKYELLLRLKQKYQINCKIIPTVAPVSVNRRLATIHNMCKLLQIPTTGEMVNQL